MDQEPIKYISIEEFRTAGYLQEVNRRFLHPLGLALEVRRDDDGTEALGGIWDYRDDPEGMNFADEPDAAMIEKARRIDAELAAKATSRQATLGYVVQPFEAK